jgi:hypothetical protein
MELPNSYHMLRLISNREAISANELRCVCISQNRQGSNGSHSKARLLLMMGRIATKDGNDLIPTCKNRPGGWILLNGSLYNRFGAQARKDRYNGSPRTRRGRSPTSPIAWRISKRLRGGRR